MNTPTGSDLFSTLQAAVSALPPQAQKKARQRLVEACLRFNRGQASASDFAASLLPQNLFLPDELALLRSRGVIKDIAQA